MIKGTLIFILDKVFGSPVKVMTTLVKRMHVLSKLRVTLLVKKKNQTSNQNFSKVSRRHSDVDQVLPLKSQRKRLD